jgi:hypothetical protein
MRSFVFAATVAMLADQAAAQEIDGVWQIEVQTQIGLNSAELVITGDQWAMDMLLTTPQGYRYESTQSGVIEWMPPDLMRLVVLSFAPTHQGGDLMARPPNGQYRILEVTPTSLSLLDLLCVANSDPVSCTSNMTRRR